MTKMSGRDNNNYNTTIQTFKELASLIMDKQIIYLEKVFRSGGGPGNRASLSYVITPDIVSFYNYMHLVIGSALRDIPLDVCTQNGGYMCTNIKVIRSNETDSQKGATLANNYDISVNLGNSLLTSAIRVLDSIQIDGIDNSVNIRNEYVSNLSVVNDLFTTKLKEFQEDIANKNTELVTVTRDLNACQSMNGIFDDTKSLLSQINVLKSENSALGQRLNENQIYNQGMEEQLRSYIMNVENLNELLDNLRNSMSSSYDDELKRLSVFILNIADDSKIHNDRISSLMTENNERLDGLAAASFTSSVGFSAVNVPSRNSEHNVNAIDVQRLIRQSETSELEFKRQLDDLNIKNAECNDSLKTCTSLLNKIGSGIKGWVEESRKLRGELNECNDNLSQLQQEISTQKDRNLLTDQFYIRYFNRVKEMETKLENYTVENEALKEELRKRSIETATARPDEYTKRQIEELKREVESLQLALEVFAENNRRREYLEMFKKEMSESGLNKAAQDKRIKSYEKTLAARFKHIDSGHPSKAPTKTDIEAETDRIGMRDIPNKYIAKMRELIKFKEIIEKDEPLTDVYTDLELDYIISNQDIGISFLLLRDLIYKNGWISRSVVYMNALLMFLRDTEDLLEASDRSINKLKKELAKYMDAGELRSVVGDNAVVGARYTSLYDDAYVALKELWNKEASSNIYDLINTKGYVEVVDRYVHYQYEQNVVKKKIDLAVGYGLDDIKKKLKSCMDENIKMRLALLKLEYYKRVTMHIKSNKNVPQTLKTEYNQILEEVIAKEKKINEMDAELQFHRYVGAGDVDVDDELL